MGDLADRIRTSMPQDDIGSLNTRMSVDLVAYLLQAKGIAFAEWGPGDMALSLGVQGRGAETKPEMVAARAKIFAACKANKIFFLNSMNPSNVVAMIQEGVMVGPASQQAAEIAAVSEPRPLIPS